MMFSKIDANQTTWHRVKWHNRYIMGEMARVVINVHGELIKVNEKLTKRSTFSILGYEVEAGSIYKGEFESLGLE